MMALSPSSGLLTNTAPPTAASAAFAGNDMSTVTVFPVVPLSGFVTGEQPGREYAAIPAAAATFTDPIRKSLLEHP
jgi:hypothetical protein